MTLTNVSTLAPFPAVSITGTAFRDFNSDGLITADGTITDIGVPNIAVTAYDAAGNVAGSAVTDANGDYIINPTSTGPYRIVFSDLPNGYEPTTHNTANGSSVQYVTSSGGATNVNLAINRPADYSQSGVRLAVPAFLSGDQSETTGVLYDFPYTNSGNAPTPRAIAQANEIGSTWGLAYQRMTKKLYASAVVRRHSGLGSQGLGGLYAVDYASGTPVVGTFVNLESAPFNINFGTLGSNAARGLPTSPTQPSQDATAFGAVGKQGIGDIDLTEDGNTLWVVNLNGVTSNVAGSLIELDVTGGAAPTSATSHPISGFSGLPSCTNGVLRPWALKFANDKGYLGVVCSAELAGGSRANLVGYVLSFDPSAPTAFSTELTIPLTYNKGRALVSTNFGKAPANTDQWYPWTDTYSDASFNIGNTGFVARPTPILADIEFDDDGAMILGFIDRVGLPIGFGNYRPTSTTGFIGTANSGDILRACLNGAGGYDLESNGTCGGINGSGVGNSEGPGGGEFYSGDLFNSSPDDHEEITLGGLAILAGSGEVVTSAYDPVNDYDVAGVLFLSNQNGARTDGYEVIPMGDNTNVGFFGKATAIGDVELLLDPAPIEIGNRVWDDLDGDGEQDAGEPGLDGLTITLVGADGANTTTSTDANGHYYFGNLTPYTAYTLTMAVPAGYELTAANQIALSGASAQSNHAISDTLDSDAALIGGAAAIYYSTGGPGQNNHGLDFGFTQPVTGQVDILNVSPPALTVDKQFNGSGAYRVGETISFTIRITNTGDITLTTLPLEDRYSSVFMTYQTANPLPSHATAGILTWADLLSGDADGLGVGEAMTVDVFFTTATDTTLLPASSCNPQGHAPNLASSMGATTGTVMVIEDSDDTDCASVQILNSTGSLLTAHSAQQTAEGVLVRWTTANESEIVGFHIWQLHGVEAQQRNTKMIVALLAGQASGASYEWLDAGAMLAPGDRYLLEIFTRDGTSERIIIGGKTGVEIFLPLTAR
ncbi:MAG: SdrD B-like domain-containing protein [Caldilineaceae bacterium]